MPRPNRESRTSKPPAAGSAVAAPAAPANGRTGGVSVLVPLAHGVMVIRITSQTRAGPFTRSYLLRVIGAMKFTLTRFKDKQDDEPSSYTVLMGPATRACGCDDWRRNHEPCKHILAIESLIKNGQL